MKIVKTNLNESKILVAGAEPLALSDHSVRTGPVSCFFRDIRDALIEQISEADVVLGCVAWLTDPYILAALSTKHSVSLVVQKEEFLRPDENGIEKDTFKRRLHANYAELKGTWRHDFNGLASRLSDCGNIHTDPVRCVGVTTRGPAVPRMHHKFALFCKGHMPEMSRDEWIPYTPYALWTGSFNWSQNSSNSLENAVLLTDPSIVAAYYSEFQQVLALSEPLNWFSDYVEPEWRIGS
jgi:hypothetical protein